MPLNENMSIPIKDVSNEHEVIVRQDHERRITILEVTMGTLASKMDNVDAKMDKVKETVEDGNKEQRALLNTINNRMVDEFFTKKSVNLNNTWKLVLGLLGGGSFLYLLFEKIINSLG